MKVQNRIQCKFSFVQFLKWVLVNFKKIILGILIFFVIIDGLPYSLVWAGIGYFLIYRGICVKHRKKKLEQARQSGTSLAGVLVGLEDFYAPKPFNVGVSQKGFKEFKQKNPGLCPLRFLDSLTPDAGTVFFYYTPKEFAAVKPEDKNALVEKIGYELSSWKRDGQEIIVICEEETYKEIDKKNWNNLTRQLQSLLFDIRFDTKFILSKGNQNTKMDYIRMQLRDCENATDAAQAFYGYIKIAEYIFHYRGLYTLTKEETAINKLKVFSMGDWNSMQTERLKDWKGYPFPDVEAAMRVCREAAHKETSSNAKITYYDICVILVQLRNMYIGHGTMAYSVSNELLNSVKTIVSCIISFFEQDECELLSNRSCVIASLCLGNYLPCIVVENGLEYMLTNVSIEKDSMQAEYLNYETGDLVTRGESRRISLLGDDIVKQHSNP